MNNPEALDQTTRLEFEDRLSRRRHRAGYLALAYLATSSVVAGLKGVEDAKVIESYEPAPTNANYKSLNDQIKYLDKQTIVGTWNMQGKTKYHLNDIKEIYETNQVDFFSLQEVHKSDEQIIGNYLKREGIESYIYFVKSDNYLNGQGNLIISRQPALGSIDYQTLQSQATLDNVFVATKQLFLSIAGGNFNNISSNISKNYEETRRNFRFRARVVDSHGKVRIISIGTGHVSPRTEHGYHEEQIEKSLDFAASPDDREVKPTTIFCQDFNEQDTKLALKAVKREFMTALLPTNSSPLGGKIDTCIYRPNNVLSYGTARVLPQLTDHHPVVVTFAAQ